MRARLAPDHELSLKPRLWDDLMQELRRRGENQRESGAFLLGRVVQGRREVEAFVPYDDLDPDCLRSGIVRFSAAGYSPLYDRCEAMELEVVGDVHTHPTKAFFSGADRQHPMMSTVGHVALVVPNYADGRPSPADVCFNAYLGGKRWRTINPGPSERRVYVGCWS